MESEIRPGKESLLTEVAEKGLAIGALIALFFGMMNFLRPHEHIPTLQRLLRIGN